jgi:uncharacterized protein YabE (DUF348 family)
VRRTPLTLAVFAVILAALAAAATAFVTMDKTVRVDVDGQVSAVRTFAGDVAGVLRKAEIRLGAHDTVAPDLGAPVTDGSRVIVRHGRLLTLTVDGQHRQVWVTAMTVDEALDQLGLRANGEWLSASRSLSIPRQGLALELRLPQHVTVLVDGRRHVAVTTAATVSDLLRELRIRLHKLDHVNVPLQRYPVDGMVVTVDRISQRMVHESVAIPFHTHYVKSSSLYVGDSQVTRYGVPGVRVNTFKLTWKNKHLVRRVLVSSKVSSRPETQIVAVGTKPRPQYLPYNDGLNWGALAQCESGGNPQAVSSNGEYRGLYQFTMGTWESVGGNGDPIDASSNEQTYRAQLLYRRSGDSPWPVCGHYLYS